VRGFPIIPCNLCGSQENLKRKEVKRTLIDWEKRFPGRVETIFNSLTRVVPSHLMDARLFDFKGLEAPGVVDAEGDIAFDEEPCTASEPITLTRQED
jgi:tRNA 2-thiocytidine biosynthesis protein TtcA